MAVYLARTFEIPVATDPSTPRSVNFAYAQAMLTGVTSGGMTYGTFDVGSAILGSLEEAQLNEAVSSGQWRSASRFQAANALADLRVWRAFSCGSEAVIVPVVLKIELWEDDVYGEPVMVRDANGIADLVGKTPATRRLGPTGYVAVGAALGCAQQAITAIDGSWFPRLRDLLETWAYIHILPLAFASSGLRLGRVGVGITVVLYFMAIGLLLWLLFERRPFRMAGVHSWIRPVLAWATFEGLFGCLIAVLGLMGWLKD
jgi:hypothetical protein